MIMRFAATQTSEVLCFKTFRRTFQFDLIIPHVYNLILSGSIYNSRIRAAQRKINAMQTLRNKTASQTIIITTRRILTCLYGGNPGPYVNPSRNYMKLYKNLHHNLFAQNIQSFNLSSCSHLELTNQHDHTLMIICSQKRQHNKNTNIQIVSSRSVARTTFTKLSFHRNF